MVCPFDILARLSKAKSTTHDFAQAIMKKLFKQKTYYPISWCVVSATGTVCRGFCLTSLIFNFVIDPKKRQQCVLMRAIVM